MLGNLKQFGFTFTWITHISSYELLQRFLSAAASQKPWEAPQGKLWETERQPWSATCVHQEFVGTGSSAFDGSISVNFHVLLYHFPGYFRTNKGYERQRELLSCWKLRRNDVDGGEGGLQEIHSIYTPGSLQFAPGSNQWPSHGESAHCFEPRETSLHSAGTWYPQEHPKKPPHEIGMKLWRGGDYRIQLPFFEITHKRTLSSIRVSLPPQIYHFYPTYFMNLGVYTRAGTHTHSQIS